MQFTWTTPTTPVATQTVVCMKTPALKTETTITFASINVIIIRVSHHTKTPQQLESARRTDIFIRPTIVPSTTAGIGWLTKPTNETRGKTSIPWSWTTDECQLCFKPEWAPCAHVSSKLRLLASVPKDKCKELIVRWIHVFASASTEVYYARHKFGIEITRCNIISNTHSNRDM